MIDQVTQKLFENIYESMQGYFVEQVSGATPVISFGDYTKSNIATFGINPSSLEFVDRSGQILAKNQKRLVDLESLNLPLDDHYGSINSIPEIWDGCKTYFSANNNPYWDWFDDLEKILQSFNFSYKDDSVCHLDLFPLATKTMFSKLSEADQFVSVTRFNHLLRDQLMNSQIKYLLFNGATTEKWLSVGHGYELSNTGKIEYSVQGRKIKSNLYEGKSNAGQIVLGWSANLQAFRGTAEEKNTLQSEIINWLKPKLHLC
jgi:hypothetical protein